jgi:phosphohistidine phosphatase
MLYLVRHGKAEQGIEDDASRALTPGGRKAVRRVAERLAGTGVRVARVDHSGLVRARQTAEILAETLGAQPMPASGLRPADPVEPLAARLQDENLMLAGHNPFMERLATVLLIGTADPAILHFRTAAVACLSRETGRWTLEWFLEPDLA